MSTDGLDAFWEEHHSLVVAACEWRAMHADPVQLAAEVRDRLERERQSPTLFAAFHAIRAVTFDAYVRTSGSRSILDTLRGITIPVANAPQDSKREEMLREQLSRLGEKEREIVQLALWDHLTVDEISQVLRLQPGEVARRLQRAIGRYSALVAKKEPAHDSGDLAEAIRHLKPGAHTRWDREAPDDLD